MAVDPAITQWSPQRIMAHKLYGLSPYVYVRNNPLNRFDPDGYVDWWKVGLGTVGVIGGIGEAVSGGAIAAGTGVTGVGAVGGVALMVHGFSTTGFGVATMMAGFKDDGTEVPSGPLEAIGGEVGGETGKKVGAAADALISAGSGGNPLKSLKNAGTALPTSAKQASKMAGYQKEVAKELYQTTTTVVSEVQAVDKTKQLVEEIKEEDEKENGNGTN